MTEVQSNKPVGDVSKLSRRSKAVKNSLWETRPLNHRVNPRQTWVTEDGDQRRHPSFVFLSIQSQFSFLRGGENEGEMEKFLQRQRIDRCTTISIRRTNGIRTNPGFLDLWIINDNWTHFKERVANPYYVFLCQTYTHLNVKNNIVDMCKRLYYSRFHGKISSNVVSSDKRLCTD